MKRKNPKLYERRCLKELEILKLLIDSDGFNLEELFDAYDQFEVYNPWVIDYLKRKVDRLKQIQLMLIMRELIPEQDEMTFPPEDEMTFPPEHLLMKTFLLFPRPGSKLSIHSFNVHKNFL